jgi:DNA-binding transcriptional ArsR family regulator
MNGPIIGDLEAAAVVFSALSSPSRLKIVAGLEEGEMTVSSITELVGSDISTVSRHLSVLRSAGILSRRRNGNRVLYSLAKPCVLDFFRCLGGMMTSDGGCACAAEYRGMN